MIRAMGSQGILLRGMLLATRSESSAFNNSSSAPGNPVFWFFNSPLGMDGKLSLARFRPVR